jgi:hypothetical protein
MAYSPRTRAAIRDSLLDNRSSRHLTQTNQPLLIVEGSDAYMEADAIGVELEGLEKQAKDNTDALLPDKAPATILDRHGAVEGVTREPATACVLVVQITGGISTTITYGSKQLVSTSGVKYKPAHASDPTDGSGNADITVTAQTLGTAGNLAMLATLTWDSTPTGANPTATVQTVTTVAEDAEQDGPYALRIIARRQERPASGNRADWAAWILEVDGVGDVYIYPLTQPTTFDTGIPGCLVAVALGPPPAAGHEYDPTNPRLLSGPALANILAYIEGTQDAAGNAVAAASQKQLRPVTMAQGDYDVIAPATITLSIDLTVTQGASTTPSWAGSFAVFGTGTTTSNVIVTGDASALANKSCAFRVSTLDRRGGYHVATPTSAVYNSGTGRTTLTGFVLDGVPFGNVIPAAPNDDAIRKAVFSHFDAFGPADEDGDVPSRRWPAEEVRGRATLYRPALQAAVIAGAPGVLSALVTSPGADQTPNPRVLATLGLLTITNS